MKRTILVSALSSVLLPGAGLMAQDDSSSSSDAPATKAADTTDDTAQVKDINTADDIWTRSRLTGDWWGARTTLEDHGLSLGLRLSQYYQGVTSGGARTGDEYGGTVDYRFNVDGGKLFNAQGLSLDVHARSRFGEDVHEKAGDMTLTNTGLLMPLPGDYSQTDVTGFMVNQMFPVGEDHIGLASIGQIDIVDAITLFFPIVGYGQEGFWNVNSMVSAEPWLGAVAGLSLFGGYVATMNTRYQIGQSGLVVTGPRMYRPRWAVFQIHSMTGFGLPDSTAFFENGMKRWGI